MLYTSITMLRAGRYHHAAHECPHAKCGCILPSCSGISHQAARGYISQCCARVYITMLLRTGIDHHAGGGHIAIWLVDLVIVRRFSSREQPCVSYSTQFFFFLSQGLCEAFPIGLLAYWPIGWQACCDRGIWKKIRNGFVRSKNYSKNHVFKLGVTLWIVVIIRPCVSTGCVCRLLELSTNYYLVYKFAINELAPYSTLYP